MGRLENRDKGFDDARIAGTPGDPRAAAAATLLLEAADHANQGLPRYRWWGYAGPCDTAGYGIRDLGDAWNDRVSSMHIHYEP
ncbi:hypothetical protein [Nonomuraea sp. NPDC048826]|uniref:hypothetical protein n=1 Tax=Nonomuraea sp. NPDC048826 TaxID=3364347 RepID=UPI003721B08F